MQSKDAPGDRNLGRKTDRCANNYDTRQMEINTVIELDRGARESTSDGKFQMAFMKFWAQAIKET